jgi:plasmid stabilization system protein ParE
VKIEIYPRAEADIVRQIRYYRVDQDAPAAAFRFREALIESMEQLKPHPRIGTLFQGSIPGLRSWPVKGFEAIRIYYVELPGCLRVVRILHGKRNVRRILKQEKQAEE